MYREFHRPFATGFLLFVLVFASYRIGHAQNNDFINAELGKHACDFVSKAQAETILGMAVTAGQSNDFLCSYFQVGYNTGPGTVKQVNFMVWFSRSPHADDMENKRKNIAEYPIRDGRYGVARDVPGFADRAIWLWVPEWAGTLYAFHGGTIQTQVIIGGMPEAEALKSAKEIAARAFGGAGATGYAYVDSTKNARPGTAGTTSTSAPAPVRPRANPAQQQEASKLFDQGVALDQSGKFAEAAAAFRASCDKGSADGCTVLGVFYIEGRGVAKDAVRSTALYKQGCDGGDEMGCYSLGVNYANGFGVAKDPARAAALYQQACAGNYFSGCYNLGLAYENGAGVAKDAGRAIGLYQKACDGSEFGACGNLGILYKNGIGTPRDYNRAIALYEKACNGDSATACFNLGLMYSSGTGVTQDYRRVITLYQKACEENYFNACFNLGLLYHDGTGVPVDFTRASTFYQKACDGKQFSACFNLGLMYQDGDELPRDVRRAGDLYRRACDGGNAKACTRIR